MMLSVYTSKKFENTVTAINVFLNQVEIQYPSNVCKYHFFAREESPFTRETKHIIIIIIIRIFTQDNPSVHCTVINGVLHIELH